MAGDGELAVARAASDGTPTRGRYSSNSLAGKRNDNRPSGQHRRDMPAAGDPPSTSNT